MSAEKGISRKMANDKQTRNLNPNRKASNRRPIRMAKLTDAIALGYKMRSGVESKSRNAQSGQNRLGACMMKNHKATN